jgi:hypothetical protein
MKAKALERDPAGSDTNDMTADFSPCTNGGDPGRVRE